MKTALLNKMFNVSRKEWPRILLAWSLNLFLRMGFVMGWTITIAMFIHRIGIERLPFLLILNALLVMLGTIVYSHLLQWIKGPLLMVYTTLTAGALLFSATLFVYTSELAFFALILMAQSIFLSQLNILISLFTEDLFSPLESQRAFPLITSSETLGGILGGLMVAVLSSFIPPYKFIYLWIFALILIIPTLLTSHAYHKKTPSLKLKKFKDKKPRSKHWVESAQSTLAKIRKIPFLSGVVGMILLQFMLINLFEFQYVKAIERSVREKSKIEFEIKDYQPNTTLNVSLLNVKNITPSPKIDSHHDAAIEEKITQSLGLLQIIFSAASLMVQCFLGSRVLNSLGIVGSLLVHPLVTLLNLFNLTFNFNFFSAAVGRSSLEITSGLFHNAYHSSYYAIAENMRSQIKELIEGFVKPMGAIVAFVAIFFVQEFTAGQKEIFVINVIMISISLLMAIRLGLLQRHYTLLSHHNLNLEHDLPTRMNAIEILAQKGHKINHDILTAHLRNEMESPQVKIKILETLGLRDDADAISEILDCFKSKDEELRYAAVEALLKFKNLKNELQQRPFTRYRVIQEAKHLFTIEESGEIRSVLIQLLAKVNEREVIPFILKILKKTPDEKIKRACIKVCGYFQDENIIPYLRKYLKDKNPMIQAETLIALWPFLNSHKQCRSLLEKWKQSSQKAMILASLTILGERGTKEDLPYLIQHLASTDQEIRYKATKSICKLNHPASIPHIVGFLMHEDQKVAKKMKRFVKHLDKSIVESIEQLAHLRVSEFIHDIFAKTEANDLTELDLSTLQKLKMAYQTLDEHEEVFKINQIIDEKNRDSDSLHFVTPSHNAVPA